MIFEVKYIIFWNEIENCNNFKFGRSLHDAVDCRFESLTQKFKFFRQFFNKLLDHSLTHKTQKVESHNNLNLGLV